MMKRIQLPRMQLIMAKEIKRNPEIKELQDLVIGLAIEFRKNTGVDVKESKLYHDMVSYLGDRLMYEDFNNLKLTAYLHLCEIYKTR